MSAQSPLRTPLWQELRQREEPATVADLAAVIGARRVTVATWLSRWHRDGFLNREHRSRYRMVDTCRSLNAPPVGGKGGRDGRRRMWRAIRILKRFDLVQLMLSAEVSGPSAKQYLSCLARAGIVRRTSRAKPGSGQVAAYSLIDDRGPLPPVVRMRLCGTNGAALFDPNTGTSISLTQIAPFFEGAN